MKIEHPAAFSLVLQDEIYLLNKDKTEYSKPAVAEAVNVELPVKAPPVNFTYLGGNKKSFLVITHYPTHEFIAEIHFTALENIFKRLEFGLDDIAILNRARYQDIDFSDLAAFFKPQKLLVLGDKALPVDMQSVTRNNSEKLGDCNTLYSYSFDEMMDNQDYKKTFWEQIKKL